MVYRINIRRSMEPLRHCQTCQRPPTGERLSYRRGEAVVHNPDLLQCDICERFACADCLRVYAIVSDYDFLCHDCAREMQEARLRGGH
jgi:hypothetical protein